MSVNKVHYQTFKKGSKTYFNSSLFFPKKVREDVFRLYGFVRVADDYVDAVPQDKEGFYTFVKAYREALDSGVETGNIIIDSFVALSKEKNFPPSWTEAFLHSMEMDLHKSRYESLEETLEYIYGSAEVIGLYMSRLMGLKEEAFPYAEALGRAMQYINFIRDIDEDNGLGRQYIPLGDSSLRSLTEGEAKANKGEFVRFIRKNIDQYLMWQKEAEKGFSYIPYRYCVPIKTASDMYNWTANEIYKDPMIIFERKVKPKKGRIIGTIIKNALLLAGKKRIKD